MMKGHRKIFVCSCGVCHLDLVVMKTSGSNIRINIIFDQ
jgi:D-arabinose 1-dehydrogenase-like Zn-dependent alcohol dehydrogenase